jgi:hypothetical protein
LAVFITFNFTQTISKYEFIVPNYIVFCNLSHNLNQNSQLYSGTTTKPLLVVAGLVKEIVPLQSNFNTVFATSWACTLIIVNKK